MDAETHTEAVIIRPAEIDDTGRIGKLITEPTAGETMTDRLAPILSDLHTGFRFVRQLTYGSMAETPSVS